MCASVLLSTAAPAVPSKFCPRCRTLRSPTNDSTTSLLDRPSSQHRDDDDDVLSYGDVGREGRSDGRRRCRRRAPRSSYVGDADEHVSARPTVRARRGGARLVSLADRFRPRTLSCVASSATSARNKAAEPRPGRNARSSLDWLIDQLVRSTVRRIRLCAACLFGSRDMIRDARAFIVSQRSL